MSPTDAASPFKLIDETDELRAVCERFAHETFVTVDTEFMRETTYYPKLCLIQLASADEVVLIDSLAEALNLAPFFALMANPSVTKVFHAARQDLEIVWQKGGLVPSPLVDTQVAAMVCGYGEQVGYESLATGLAGAKIDKSSRFTDWTRRPLSPAQLAYAAADVTHLRVVHEKLAARIAKNNRQDWVSGEMAILSNPKNYETVPEEAWLRIKSRLRKPAERLALRELAAWREREAQARDVPRGRVLKDDALVEIAMAQPKSVAELGNLRAVPNGFERSRAGAEILEAIARAAAADPASLPAPEADKPNVSGALVQLLKVLLQSVADRHHVASRLIGNSDDVEQLAAKPDDLHAILEGWRGEVYGKLALQLIRGEVTLGLEKGRVVPVPRQPAPSG
ncbi:Rnd Ribonuclease D [Rhabdaerophilaceae bacterium]